MGEWLVSMGPAVANHLWQSTAFVVVAWAVALLLRRNHARARYWIWMAASVKFLAPMALLISLGGMLPRPGQTVVTMPVYSAVDEVSLPFEVQGTRESAQLPVVSSPKQPVVPEVVGVVWAAGFVMVLGVWWVRWRRVAGTVRRAVRANDGREAELLERVQRRMDGVACVRLVLSHELMEPGIFGIFRPVLIWPVRLSERLDDEHIEAILIHELAHVRRRDNLTATLHMLVEAAFWFHPLAWWVGTRLVEERERACDETVVELCGQAQAYAESILKVCEFCVESPLACVAGVTGADLKQRIVAIMTARVARKLGVGKKLLLLAVGMAVVAVPLVLGQGKAAQRMMLALAQVSNARPGAPGYLGSIRTAAREMIALEQTPMTGEIAEVQAPSGLPLPQGQAEAEPFKFDVVSIRPAAPEPDGRKRRIGFQFTADGFGATNQSLVTTLMRQYQPELQGDSSRIVGGPDWVRTQPWDIRAKVADADIAEWSKLSHDSSAEAKERLRATVDAMLAERFKLKTHFETKEGTIYALVVAKGGPKLKPSTLTAPPQVLRIGMGQGHFSSEWATVGSLVPVFARELGHPVIDKTGVTGSYDLKLDWAPAQDAPSGDAAQASAPGGPSLFTAVQEQLGLKLEAQKGPIETLVIDSAEKPSVDGAEVQGTGGREQGTASSQAAATPDWQKAAGGRMEFEVASIRPTPPEIDPSRPSHRPNFPISNDDSYTAGPNDSFIADFSLVTYIQFAYKLRLSPDQLKAMLAGAPKWVSEDNYEIRAKASGPVTKDQLRLMMQALLADRFKLGMHFETRESPVLALTLDKPGKLGPSLHPHAEGPACDQPDPKAFPARCYVDMRIPVSGGLLKEGSRDNSMEVICHILTGVGRLDHPLVNQTGLTGNYDFSIEWSPAASRVAASDADASPDAQGPTFLEALQEQLGMKIVPTQAPLEFLVIDHIERPTEN
jgi:uncharacterized protein (TIGR03435 family)